jgi:hypothetical protein
MKNVFEHIEHIKGKPHHVRRRVAFGMAALGSAFVAFVWLGVSLTTGSFAIKGSSFALTMGQDEVIATTSASGVSALAGAAAAFGDTRSSSAPAHIEIVDTTPDHSTQKQPEQTILPF